MLDDGDYIVIGKLMPGGEAAGKGYSKMLCVVYVCDDRNIHTHRQTHTHIHSNTYTRTRVHTRTQRVRERDTRTWTAHMPV